MSRKHLKNTVRMPRSIKKQIPWFGRLNSKRGSSLSRESKRYHLLQNRVLLEPGCSVAEKEHNHAFKKSQKYCSIH